MQVDMRLDGSNESHPKYAKPNPNAPLYVIVDLGNSDAKGMIFGQFGNEVWFPHAVRKPSTADYNNHSSRLKNRTDITFDGTAYFKMGDQGYIVGRHVAQNQSGERKLAAAKYERSHFGALFVAMMLHLFPQSHNDVHVVVLHPADITMENQKALWKSLKGTHSAVLPNGKKVEYTVTEIIPLEEVIAGVQALMLNNEGQPAQRKGVDFKAGTNILLIDVGGGLTSFMACTISDNGKIVPNRDNPPVAKAGIQRVLESFETELKDAREEDGKTLKFPALQPVQKLNEQMLANALMSGYIEISGGKAKDCSAEVAKAFKPLDEAITPIYNDRYGSGIDFGAIVITGGGGGLAFNHLNDLVLRHERVFPAVADPNRMRFGNILGACKGLIVYLLSQRKKA